MTLVWKTPSGSLLQTQVGTVDIVNTFSAARSIHGWMGGTDGLRFLLQRILNPFGQRLKILELDQNLRLMPFQGHVLTSHGPLVAHLNDAQESFGGDIRTQVIGTTLCALAHECQILTAVRLFCRFLLPFLFGEASLLIDVLQSHLMEDATLGKIINEGACRGLNNLFIDTATKLDLPEANCGFGPIKLGEKDLDYKISGPVSMIGGLLKWITQDGSLEYRTRSSAVARIAAYLKAVGYNIGSIRTWNGNGAPPGSIGTKSVILVLGGSSQTDPFMEEDVPGTPLLLHYQHRTVGAMLLTALGHLSDILPENLQEDFEQVFAYIEDHLTVEYTWTDDIICAVPRWREADQKPTSMATRLASIYFSHTAEFIAPCYDRIAKQKYLNCVKGKSRKLMQPNETKLGRFRAITASVAISIISRFAPGTFKTAHHATLLNLSQPGWLSSVCSVLDLDDSFRVPTVVALLASVHVGVYVAHRRESIPAAGTDVIAWRNGIYSVIPSLLLDMKLSPETFEFVCLDHFWANVKARENGSIQSSNTPDVQRYELDTDPLCNTTDLASSERLVKPYIGLPELSAPDSPLYLSLGTPLHYGESHLCFMGWFGGSIAGTVGVMDVLKAVLMSRVEPEICPGHVGGPKQVVNVKTSIWAQEPYSKPIDRQYPVYVPVGGDHCWAIFVAGQMVNQGGRIVFRCPTCADENYKSPLPDGSGSDNRPRCFVGFCERDTTD